MNENKGTSNGHFEELAKNNSAMQEYLIARNAFLEKYAIKKPNPKKKDTN